MLLKTFMFVENKAVRLWKAQTKNQKKAAFTEAATRGALKNLHEKTWGLQLKNGTRAKAFSCEFCKISKHTFFT